MTLISTVKVPITFALGAVTALMSPTDIKEIIIAFGVLIAGVGVVIVNIITARSAAKRQEATLRKVEVIEGHVNSEKTESAGRIALLQNENALLRDMLTDKKTTAALLAQAAATSVAVPSTPTVPARTTELSVLKKTEQNTAATAESAAQTAENTAKTEASTVRTEAAVQDLKEKP